jgi:hypothetical protein
MAPINRSHIKREVDRIRQEYPNRAMFSKLFLLRHIKINFYKSRHTMFKLKIQVFTAHL